MSRFALWWSFGAPVFLTFGLFLALDYVGKHEPQSAPTPALACPIQFARETADACRGSCVTTGVGRMTWDLGPTQCHLACECMQVPPLGTEPKVKPRRPQPVKEEG